MTAFVNSVIEAPLSQRTADPVALAGGTSGVVLSITILLVTFLGGQVKGVNPAVNDSRGSPDCIEAIILKLGEPLEPNALPSRDVPPRPSVPDEALVLDRDEDKAQVDAPPEKKRRQADAVTDDKLREVFEKIRAFNEFQDDFVPIGHPDGVPDGDVTDPALSSQGATYMRQIRRVFLERWFVPTLLSEAAKNRLEARVLITVDGAMEITSVRLTKRSGNALFDDAVQMAVDRVRREVRRLPPPPTSLAPTVFGHGIALTFNGSDAAYETPQN